jgi:hypothetical protein
MYAVAEYPAGVPSDWPAVEPEVVPGLLLVVVPCPTALPATGLVPPGAVKVVPPPLGVVGAPLVVLLFGWLLPVQGNRAMLAVVPEAVGRPVAV